jgi:hypothetical protein
MPAHKSEQRCGRRRDDRGADCQAGIAVGRTLHLSSISIWLADILTQIALMSGW